MVLGRVKWFDPQKGFGFIAVDEPAGGEDVFVGSISLREAGITELREGDRVLFLIERDGKGRTRAADIQLQARA